MKLGKENISIAIELWHCLNEKRWDDARKLLSEEFVADWPQSKEKMDADGFIEVNRNYPGQHEIQIFNFWHDYDSWEHRSHVTTLVYIKSVMPDGKKLELYATSFFEIEDGKILTLDEYWAETYPPPDWRKQWVQRY